MGSLLDQGKAARQAPPQPTKTLLQEWNLVRQMQEERTGEHHIQIVVPEGKRQKVWKHFHEPLQHMGQRRPFLPYSRGFFLTKIRADI
jgi:hypothetical protein